MTSFESWLDTAKNRIASGNNPNLFQWMYVQVDSVVDETTVGQFDITDLQVAGLDGWDIVAVIPKTLGTALTNLSTHGNTWGGGMGGNVLGVYVLLSKEVTNIDDPLTRKESERIVQSLINRGVNL